MNRSTSNTTKILVPLATLVVAGAVAIGSGATFTSESAHNVKVTSGILKHTNNKDGMTLEVTNLRPGDVKTGTLTLTNDGTIDSTISLAETADSSSFVAGDLKLQILDGTTEVYNGNFGAMPATPVDLGALNVGQVKTLTYTVTMPPAAGNGNQNKAASANYQVVQTQVDSPTSVISWIPGLG